MAFEIGDIVYEVSNGQTLAQKWTVTDVDGDLVGIEQIGGAFQEERISKVVSSAELVSADLGSGNGTSNTGMGFAVVLVALLFMWSQKRRK